MHLERSRAKKSKKSCVFYIFLACIYCSSLASNCLKRILSSEYYVANLLSQKCFIEESFARRSEGKHIMEVCAEKCEKTHDRLFKKKNVPKRKNIVGKTTSETIIQYTYSSTRLSLPFLFPPFVFCRQPTPPIPPTMSIPRQYNSGARVGGACYKHKRSRKTPGSFLV